jgi:hypothetical protein
VKCRSRLIIALMFLSLLACTKREVRPQAVFNINDYSEYLGSGSGGFKGTAYVEKVRGGQVTCAGNSVFLLPKTPYFTEVVELGKSGNTVTYAPELMAQVKEVIRYTKCDVQGKFQFQNLPSASWYVMVAVSLGEFPKQKRRILVTEVLSRSNEVEDLKVTESN